MQLWRSSLIVCILETHGNSVHTQSSRSQMSHGLFNLVKSGSECQYPRQVCLLVLL